MNVPMNSLQTIQGQPSWLFSSPDVEAFITRQGGHLGPVRFRIGRDRWVSPLSVAPWAEEPLAPDMPELFRVLRGDFFCMPFGAGPGQPLHGETANAAWTLVSNEPGRMELSLATTVQPGCVNKIIELLPGHSAVYQTHVITGMTGSMSFGHHAMLKLAADAGARISMSPFKIGKVLSAPFKDPTQDGYSILKPGAKFQSLSRVPQIDGKMADLSVYPARAGYEDLVQMESDTALPFAWTAAVNPTEGYVWLGVKNPRVLPATVFWISNGGRYYAPWNGRHSGVIGLEEVTGKPVKLKTPLVVRYMMAMAAIPRGFDIVKSVEPAKNGKTVKLTARSGKTVTMPLNVGFVMD